MVELGARLHRFIRDPTKCKIQLGMVYKGGGGEGGMNTLSPSFCHISEQSYSVVRNGLQLKIQRRHGSSLIKCLTRNVEVLSSIIPS